MSHAAQFLSEAKQIDVAASFMVGDRWSDIEAGRRAGCRTVLIDQAYTERRPDPDPDYVAANLADAATWILSQTHSCEVK